MPSKHKKKFELSFGQKITTQYVIGLGLIALLVASSYISLLEMMRAHSAWASMINLSGRQRMLSQRVSKLAHDLVMGGHDNRQAFREKISERLVQLEQAHRQIISGSAAPEYGLELSSSVKEIMFYPPHELDKKIQRFISAGRAFISMPDTGLTKENEHFQVIEEYSEKPLLDSLDALVKQFQDEAEANAESLKRRVTAITVILLLTLAVEGALIFQPLAWRIQRSADELASSQQKLAGITASLGEGVLVTDRDGVITFANPMIQVLTGYKEAELAGMPVMDLKIYRLDGAPAPLEERAILRALAAPAPGADAAGSRPITGEMMIERKTGDRLIIEVSATRLMQDSEVTGAVASIRDITMRKTMETILAAKNEMVQLLQEIAFALNEVETVDEAMKVCLEGVCNHTYWEIGHVFKPDKDGILVSSGIWHVKREGSFQSFIQVSERATFKTGIGLPGRVYMSKQPAWVKDVRKDPNFPRAAAGVDVDVRAGMAIPVLEGDKVAAALEFYSTKVLDPDDSMLAMAKYLSTQLGRVTERKRDMEAIKKAKEAAEEATRTKDKFLALVAHDMRAPLTTMLGMIKSIKTDAAHPLSEGQLGMMAKALITGENMLSLIDNLLDLERLQTGQMRVEKMSLDVRALAEEVIESLSYEAAAKNIRLVNEVERGVKIMADYELIVEVFKNLIHNAIKFCSDGDTVSIFRHPGEKGVIGVRDTGPGIRKEIAVNLFRHDIKTSTVGTAGERGTGLGLPLCQDIMKAHDGELEVLTGAGRGATFLIRLQTQDAKGKSAV